MENTVTYDIFRYFPSFVHQLGLLSRKKKDIVHPEQKDINLEVLIRLGLNEQQ